MTQFDLTDEQRQIQEMARAFTADALTPFAAEWDEKHIFPRDTIRQAAELGFGAIYVSEESGGIGLGRLESALIMEAMAYGDPSTSAFISIHNMAAWMIDRFGSAAVKQKYLPLMVTMEQLGSYCLSEPGSGSDAAALKTRAVKDGDHYVITGSKAFISGGGENEIYVTMARTGPEGPKGISAFVIEKDMPGVSFGAQEKKLGWHSQPTCQVNFDDVRVPAENLVGDLHDGWRLAKVTLSNERVMLSSAGSLWGAGPSAADLIALLRQLHARERRHVLLEGGPTLAGAFLQAGLVDRVVAYVAPVLLGSGIAALGTAGVDTITQALRVEVEDVTVLEPDVRITGRPRR